MTASPYLRARHPATLVKAARCPESLGPAEFGDWRILRHDLSFMEPYLEEILSPRLGPDFKGFVALEHRLRSGGWQCVMEDSRTELRRHLPIWMAAHGRVLVTGLGLGCVVRGLLGLPEVERIDVVEIDPEILAMVGPEFQRDPRVVFWEGDALTIDLPSALRWEYAWHDLWSPPGEPHLDVLHAQLLLRYRSRVGAQGAWQLRRWVKRLWALPLLGGSAVRWRAA